MSLLMKALKKAEESQQGGDAPTLQELAEELSLEPREQDGSMSSGKGGAAVSPAYDPVSAQGAANLFAAKESRPDGRKRLLIALSVGALLFLLAGGVYVYIAINRPGLLVSAPPVGVSASATPSLFSTQVENSMPPKIESAPEAIVEETPEVPDSAGRLPVDTASTGRSRGLPAAGGATESSVRVLRGTQPEINPDLVQAYQALQDGRLEAAHVSYAKLLQLEPRNMDALLGMASVEARSGNPGEAGRLYLRALDVEPKNAYAQGGLLSLFGGADPAGSETRLKRLLAEQPSAFLYFALGNLYASGARWPDAQQAYFQAHHLASGNPDYAFNLAVSLEHISQPKQALTYYQLALQLLGNDGTAVFNRAAAEARIARLKRMTE